MQEIIGIDHGYGNMKTRHCVFSSGIQRSITEPPVNSRVLKYKSRYYMVGGERMSVKERKSEDDDYYLLTMAALAEEMRVRGLKEVDVQLGVGLPLMRMGAEKSDFLKYLKQNEELNFSYEGTRYKVHVSGVYAFPQGYAAVAKNLSRYKRTTILLDIGSWTVDVLVLVEQTPDLARCKSLSMGTITVMEEINETLRQKLGHEIEESILKEFMITGKGLPGRYANIVKDALSSYVQRILSTLYSMKFNLELLDVVIMGGGAVLFENFLPELPENFTILSDIHINAIGYEEILKAKLGG